MTGWLCVLKPEYSGWICKYHAYGRKESKHINRAKGTFQRRGQTTYHRAARAHRASASGGPARAFAAAASRRANLFFKLHHRNENNANNHKTHATNETLKA